MSDHDHTDPLTFATAVFDRWREQRATVGARVPRPLREIACRLLDVEPLPLAARSLRIAEGTLRRWQTREDEPRRLVCADERHAATRNAHDLDNASSSAAFVPLPLPLPLPDECVAAPGSAGTPTPFASLVIERADGVRLHLGGPIDVASVAALLGTTPVTR